MHNIYGFFYLVWNTMSNYFEIFLSKMSMPRAVLRHFIKRPLQKNSKNSKIIYPLKNKTGFCLRFYKTFN